MVETYDGSSIYILSYAQTRAVAVLSILNAEHIFYNSLYVGVEFQTFDILLNAKAAR